MPVGTKMPAPASIVSMHSDFLLKKQENWDTLEVCSGCFN